MKICLAQIQPTLGGVEHNIAKHLQLIEMAIAASAEIVLFPELSITGYAPSLAKQLAFDLNDERLDTFQAVADRHHIIIGVGIPHRVADGTHISLLFFRPKQDHLTYSKQQLHADEMPYFINGPKDAFSILAEEKMAFAICYEALQKDHFLQALNDEATVYIASVAKPEGGLRKAYSYFPKLAKAYNTPILMVNSIGHCEDFMSLGKSAVWGLGGRLLAQLDESQEGILLYDTATQNALIHYVE